MKKKSFEVNENDAILEVSENDEFVVDETEVEEPMIVDEQEVTTPDVAAEVDFVQQCKQAVRMAPKIAADNSLSLKRAIAYYDKLEKRIEAGVVEDAEKEKLSIDDLKVLDNVCAEIDMVREQLKVSASRVKIIKQASKAAKFIYTVDPFIFAIARLCINAKVANGKNIEDTYQKCKKIYGLTEREDLAVRQIMRDMGYPIRGSFVGDHESFDMIKQYFG